MVAAQRARLVADFVLVVGEHEENLVLARVGRISLEDVLVERQRLFPVPVALLRRDLGLRAGGLGILLAIRKPRAVQLIVVADFLQRHVARLLPPQLGELEVHVGLARALLDLAEDPVEVGDHLVALGLHRGVARRLFGVRRGVRLGSLGGCAALRWAGVLDRVAVVADLVRPILAVELPVLLAFAGQLGPAQGLGGEPGTGIEILLDEFLLTLRGLEVDDLVLAVERVDDADELGQTCSDALRHRACDLGAVAAK